MIPLQKGLASKETPLKLLMALLILDCLPDICQPWLIVCGSFVFCIPLTRMQAPWTIINNKELTKVE